MRWHLSSASKATVPSSGGPTAGDSTPLVVALRFTTAGESHGPGLVVVLEGLPAGLELALEDLDRDLARRQLGHYNEQVPTR